MHQRMPTIAGYHTHGIPGRADVALDLGQSGKARALGKHFFVINKDLSVSYYFISYDDINKGMDIPSGGSNGGNVPQVDTNQMPADLNENTQR